MRCTPNANPNPSLHRSILLPSTTTPPGPPHHKSGKDFSFENRVKDETPRPLTVLGNQMVILGAYLLAYGGPRWAIWVSPGKLTYVETPCLPRIRSYG